MDIATLERSPVGSLIPIVGPDPATHEMVEGKAFLPDPLPQEFVLSTETWNVVNSATAAWARRAGAARLIPQPSLLRRPTLRREAQSTSALEGTYAPFTDVLASEGKDWQQLPAAVIEILNFEEMA